MSGRSRDAALMTVIAAAGLVAPWVAAAITTQLAFLWLMILFAVTWDINGGQMGYNSFGNVFFFGIGVYVCALVQRDSGLAYYPALFVGIGLGALAAGATALVLGPAILGEPGLSEDQKQTLLRIYLSFRRENEASRPAGAATAAPQGEVD